MKLFIQRAVLLMLAVLLAACSSGGYWIPPSSAQEPLYVAPNSSPTPAFSPTPNDPAPDIQLAPVGQDLPTSAPPTPTLFPTDPPAPTPTQTSPVPEAGEGTPVAVDTSPILYYSQAADTLPVLAIRFGVHPQEIFSPDIEKIPAQGLLPPGLRLFIPRRLSSNTTSSKKLLPDSELVYSPSAAGFDISEFASQAGGKLASYREWLKSTGMNTGAQVVQRVALENSINPRLLIALLEYQSGWVYGVPESSTFEEYPLGYVNPREKGLYHQLIWAVNHLSVGYYGYREGRLTEISFSDGSTARLAPDLNAGTVALQYLFSKIYPSATWLEALDPEVGFPALYTRLFGDAWARAETVEPLYPIDLVQPGLLLPFEPGDVWAFTGGPHGAWEHDGSYAAIDFAPPSLKQGCQKSDVWVTATSSGTVVRSEAGVVVLDIDGDGSELTGWVLVYLHVSHEGRIAVGTFVVAGQPLGHPSCEGGFATGTHVHIARKYNGEWIAADGPVPFNMEDWIAHADTVAYKGTLTRGDQTVTACTCSNNKTFIARTVENP